MTISSPISGISDSKPTLSSWHLDLKQAIRDPLVLIRELGLSAELACEIADVKSFPIFAPRPFVSRIEPGNARDPLLLQILPLASELDAVDGFATDPVGDLPAARSPGLLQKYEGRALLVLSGACPVHCRYCFRRHFPYDELPRSINEWSPTLDAIADDTSINEILLSGGDPLSHTDDFISQLIQRLDRVPHLKRIRIHSRYPIMIPNRVTERLLDSLAATRMKAIFVVHVNHANEIDESVANCLQSLQSANVLLLNQSVLLKGVNDSKKALIELSNRLVEVGVLPYYLNQLDRVQGSQHFEVDMTVGRQLIESIRASLPGYAVPRYVREIAGKNFKVPIQ